jgi:hypothetical protein
MIGCSTPRALPISKAMLKPNDPALMEAYDVERGQLREGAGAVLLDQALLAITRLPEAHRL